MTRYLPLGIALLGLLVVVAVMAPTAAARLTYPYDLEWMEGGMLAHAWRVRAGLPLYPPPGPEWIPYIYPPGYPTLLAAIPGDLGYLPARLVSWAGVALTAFGLLVLVGRYSAPAGVGTAAVFLALWRDTGAFYDLARPDALALGLLTVSAAAAVDRRPVVQVLGGLLLCCAFLTKHHTAAFGPAIVAGLVARDRDLRAALRFGLAAAVPAGLLTAALHGVTEGGLLNYLVAVPASHGSKWARAWPGTPWEVGSALPVAGAVAAGAAAARLSGGSRAVLGGLAALGLLAALLTLPARSAHVWDPMDAPLERLASSLPGWHTVNGVTIAGALAPAVGTASLVVLLVSGLGLLALHRRWEMGLLLFPGLVAMTSAGLMRAHIGGFVNVQMPLFTFVALVAGLSAASWMKHPALRWVALGGFVLQIGWSIIRFDGRDLAPTPEDRRVGDQIVQILKTKPGPIFSPYAPWLPVQAGHPPGPHLIALWDVSRHPQGPWPQTRRTFASAAAAGRWAVVVVGSDELGYGVEDHYRLEYKLPGGKTTFRPRTGWRARPESLWVPRADHGETEPPR